MNTKRTGLSPLWPVLLLFVGVLPAEPIQADSLTGLHVLGRGEVAVAPDLARVVLHINRAGPDAAALKQEVDAVTAAVLALAEELAMDEADVVAASVHIYPDSRPGPDGEREDVVAVNRTVHLTVRALERLPEVVDRSLELGINGVHDIHLDSSRRSQLEQRALGLAIEDARAEAQRVAAGFDARVGPVITVHVDGHSVAPQRRDVQPLTVRAGNAFVPGEIIVSRTLRAQFALEAL